MEVIERQIVLKIVSAHLLCVQRRSRLAVGIRGRLPDNKLLLILPHERRFVHLLRRRVHLALLDVPLCQRLPDDRVGLLQEVLRLLL